MQRFFSGETFLEKGLTLLLLSAFWARRNLSSVKNISEWLRLLQSKSPEEHLWEEIQFLRNYVTSKLFPDFLRTVYGQKPKISLLSCRNCIVLVLMTFFWINYKDICFYWIWAKKCSPVRKKINRVLAIAVQITRRTSSIKKQILRYYEIPRRFLEFGWTVYGHLLKMFLQSCRTCFVRVQRNTLRNFFDRSITNIITSGLWAKKKQKSLPTETLSARLWQVQSTSPHDRVDKKLKFWKNNRKKIFGFWVYHYKTLSTNIWQSVVERTFHRSKGPIWRIFWKKVCVYLFLRKWSKKNLNFGGMFLAE